MLIKAKRVFLAVDLDKEFKNCIKLLQKDYETLDLKVNLIKASNLHITLLPPWKELEIKKLILKLENFIFYKKSISLIFDKVSFGPSDSRPRLIWLTARPNKEFNKLVLELTRYLGGRLPARKILPHLTIARFNPVNFHSFNMKKINRKIYLFREIKKFALLESKLTNQGADYEIIKKFNLR